MRPRVSPAARAAVLAKTGGRCHHCNVQLGNTWDVDHFPVRYADIEDQMCCGVTDPLDIDNLVPSCRSCNRSHAHESSRWCGHSQLRCRKSVWKQCLMLVLGCAVGLTAGIYLR